MMLFSISSCSHRRNDDLKSLANAIVNYTQNNKEDPFSVYLCDSKEMHSWRVLVAPYLFSNDFFNQYDLKSSWDSPTNISLHAKYQDSVPHFFGDRVNGEDFTKYVMILLQGHSKKSYTGNVSRANLGFWEVVPGSHQNLLVVAEISDFHAHWMKPGDLSIEDLNGELRKSVRALIVCDLHSSEFKILSDSSSSLEWIDNYSNLYGSN